MSREPALFPEPTDPRADRAAVFLGYLDHFRERTAEKLLGLPAAERDGRWAVPAGAGVDQVVAALRAQGERSRAIVEAHRLDEVVRPGPRWRGAAPATLERVLFHLVQEYARHLGHLDMAVELATGDSGE